ncbi:M48 family metalloprotease [Pseudoteredinibacter isoporae]|uniref:Putative Zn-dependent protease n=1 Tax=Pseudoteredinibacter isoporae TaxID=570281 RepID=A0A7X0MVX3_9GAMM|nr:putative Zn-dependent protease [Pseudoteredinibacter isoporae]NHO85865.1 M48 family metalloprotease [Pseudoteredinibacter isoporae]NIB25683.1 M48 family metalloprotease [Pseudoteredinibacter isoporae]
MKKGFAKLIGVLALASAVVGCSTNPVTGKSQLNFISPAQEVALGEKQYGPSQQSQGGAYEVDPALSRYVNSVGQKLAQLSDRPNLPYEFVVLNNDVPNAWALPGGKIAFNRGLLIHLEDEAQLAAVLGHEIVHAAASHSAQQMSQRQLLGVGGQLAAVAATQSRYGGLIQQGIGLGSAAFHASYGRGQELEADAYGMEYMVAAGYDPQGAVELQETFVKLSEGRQSNWLNNLFASHPPSQERVAANRARAKQMPPGVRNQKAFDRAMAQLRKDAPAYKLHQEALAAANKKQMDKALSLTEQAIRKQPKEALFWDTKGKLLLNQKRGEPALKAFTRAIEINPNYFGPYVGRGIVHKNMGDDQRARIDFETSLSMLPTQYATFHLGELELKQGNSRKAYEYYQFAAASGGELGKRAQQRMHQIYPQQPAQQRRR